MVVHIHPHPAPGESVVMNVSTTLEHQEAPLGGIIEYGASNGVPDVTRGARGGGASVRGGMQPAMPQSERGHSNVNDRGGRKQCHRGDLAEARDMCVAQGAFS